MHNSVEMTKRSSNNNEGTALLNPDIQRRSCSDLLTSKLAMGLYALASLLAGVASITYAAIDSNAPNFCYNTHGSISCPRDLAQHCFTSAGGTNLTLFDNYCGNGTLINAGFSGNASSQFASCLDKCSDKSLDVLMLISGIFLLSLSFCTCCACLCKADNNQTRDEDPERAQALRHSAQ